MPEAIQVPETRLREVLTLWDLVFYGMVLVQPTAAIPMFGLTEQLSNGYSVCTYLAATLAMVITAISYGRMAAVYPVAGSAYTYVGKSINPYLGFLVGWSMLLQYILVPMLVVVWISVALHSRYIGTIPFWMIALAVTMFLTLLNLLGIQFSARANKLLFFVTCGVLAIFFVLSAHYLFEGGGWSRLFSLTPFYTPSTFDISRIWGATSFAALTFIGFSGVTTLSEDVHNPRRNVLLACVLVCILIGLLSGTEVYFGQCIWPNWHTFPNLETAFLDVCYRVGGGFLFQTMAGILLFAALGTGIACELGATRLLFGMGRDGVLPRRIFAYLHPKTNAPVYSILIVNAIAYGSALGLNYIGNAFEQGGELVNFGAFLAFMGVNLSAFWHFSLLRKGHRRRIIPDVVLPLIGFAFCTFIWWDLSILAKTVGGLWMLGGVVYLAATTRVFRRPPKMINFGGES